MSLKEPLRLPPDLGSQYDLRSLILRRRHSTLGNGQGPAHSHWLPTCIQQPRLNKHLGQFVSRSIDPMPAITLDPTPLAPSTLDSATLDPSARVLPSPGSMARDPASLEPKEEHLG